MVTFKVRNERRCKCKYNVDVPSVEDYLAACGLSSEEYFIVDQQITEWSDINSFSMECVVEVEQMPASEMLDTAEEFMWLMWLFKHLDYRTAPYGIGRYTIENRGMSYERMEEKLERLRTLCVNKERTKTALEVLCHNRNITPIADDACVAIILGVPVSDVYSIAQQPTLGIEYCEDEIEAYICLLSYIHDVLIDDKDILYKWESICVRLVAKVKEANTDLSKIIEYCLKLQKAYNLAIDAYVSIDGTREEWSEFMNANADIWENNRYAINRACCSVYSSNDYTGLLATCYAIGLPKLEGLEVPEGTRTMLDIDSEYFHGLYGLSVRTYDFTKLLDVPKSSIAECKTKEDLMELVEKYCK